MKFQTMREYPTIVVERAVRLTNIAIQLNRAAVWTDAQEQALKGNSEIDQQRYDGDPGFGIKRIAPLPLILDSIPHRLRNDVWTWRIGVHA